MKTTKIFSLFLLPLLLLPAAAAAQVKQPNVAGQFYPADKEELAATIQQYLAAASPAAMPGKIFCLIEPHAGYSFSGKTAAYGYKLVAGGAYKTVVVIGPSHYYGFPGASVYPAGAFRTPLGDCPVDEAFSKELLSSGVPVISFDPRAFEKEHSVEVEIPFLQTVLKGFSIVPVVMGQCDFSACQAVASALEKAIGKRRDVLVIVSSDMYHGYDYDEADAMDRLTLSAVTAMDPRALYSGLTSGSMQMCGGLPAVSALLLAKSLGHDKAVVLRHTNSCEATGNMRKGIWTVGYSSVAIDQPDERYKEASMLTTEQKKKLLGIARSTIETFLLYGDRLQVKETDPALTRVAGAFVTLHEHGGLRGCIGNMIGTQPLYLTVRDMAIESATRDPRFAPVNAGEVKDIEIEISALTPMKRVASADEIVLGTHGVLVRRGGSSGVFLPQVATETGWTKEQFLSHLCAEKAGLPANAWKDKATELYIFTADVFSEKEF